MSGKVVYAGKRGSGYDVYIGRRLTRGGHNLPESDWQNPYSIGPDGTREEVIEKFERYIRSRRPDLLARLGELDGQTLGCWCAGKPGIPEVLTAEEPHYCHGQVLLKLLDEGA
jgi:hypothetical protein